MAAPNRLSVAAVAYFNLDNPDADDVHILLDGGVHDHLRRLMQSRVDDFHAGVPQGMGQHLGSPIVAVETWLGD